MEPWSDPELPLHGYHVLRYLFKMYCSTARAKISQKFHSSFSTKCTTEGTTNLARAVLRGNSGLGYRLRMLTHATNQITATLRNPDIIVRGAHSQPDHGHIARP
jgi:hypothetical protein